MRPTLSSLLLVAVLAAPVPRLAAAQARSAQEVAPHADSASRAKAADLARVIVRDRATRAAGYAVPASSAASKLEGPLRDIPQSVSVVGRAAMADQAMQGMQDVVRYVPGIGMAQGEGHRDAPVIRGNTSTADFFVDGVRDDGQYLRDLYNVERIEALKGSNAMVFGRGGGGGVINRVTREAEWAPARQLTLEGGSFEHRRATVDVGGEVSPTGALRLNAMAERSALFRDATHLERTGINPTAALVVGGGTTLRAGLERFEDRRTVDRGIPSFAGAPAAVPVTTFFGDPEASRASSRVVSGNVSVEHQTSGGVTLRNRSRVARYDKWYQNVFPGAVDAAGEKVALQAYSSDILRDNLFNQSEASGVAVTGPVRHNLLAGIEVGVQGTTNFRRTGYFGGSATSTSVSFAQPTVSVPVEFHQSATDADNHVTARVAGGYVQDQLRISDRVQLVGGLRLERFAMSFDNHRNGAALARTDRMLSPRVGVVLKPAEAVSVYTTYGVSYLPGSGDQFSSLTATTATLEPERFTNREVGVKWDVRPALAFTAAAYRLDRTNTAAPDPLDASRIVQTGRQRSSGAELGVAGEVAPWWQVQGGVSLQRAEIVDRTSAAAAGASVPLVPRRTASLWNRVQLSRDYGVGLGIIRQGSSFTAIDNTVTLPAYTRADAALFATLTPRSRVQLNLENALGARYYASSQGNNNILPGAPRTLRVALLTGF